MKTIIILSHVGFDNSPYCQYVHEHAKALVKEGYKVIVFATLGWIPFASILKKERKNQYKEKRGTKTIDGVTVIYRKRLSFSNLFYDSKINLNGISYYLTIKRKIKKIISQEEVFFIDAHTFKVEGYVASVLHKKTNIPAVVTCHGTSFKKTADCNNSKYIISKIMNNLNYAICVSESIEKKFKELGIFNTKVIYNGINFYPFKNEKKDIDLITVGNFIKQKNIDIVIKSVKIILNMINNFKAIIVGQGVENQNLRDLIKELNLEDNVTIVGQISNEKVQELMQRSKVFILPSKNEGFGIVYVEAMHNKCITIGSKNEGIDGFIKNGINGFLISPEENKIANLIKDIYLEKYDIEKIKKTAYLDSVTLTWEKNAKEYIKLFSKN